MRIISGKYQRRILKPPSNLPVRPTTDLAKEALFNILNNLKELEGSKILDLFAGTGSISFEFASRGAEKVIAVDLNFKCIEYIKRIKTELDLQSLIPFKSDAFRYLQACKSQFDIIFADPPFDLAGIESIHKIVFERDLLAVNGLLIIEHSGTKSFDGLESFLQERKYGKVHFAFFERN